MGGKDGSPGAGPFHWYYLPLMWLVLGGPLITGILVINRYEKALGAWALPVFLVLWIVLTLALVGVVVAIQDFFAARIEARSGPQGESRKCPPKRCIP